MLIRMMCFCMALMLGMLHAADSMPERVQSVEVLKHLKANPSEDGNRCATLQDLYLPAGFKADLIAMEPHVKQPIAMTFDALGRLWVAEAMSYPEKRAKGAGKDRILILEDYDGDGSFERRQVFADGLNLVSGLEVGFGGVWVGAAPELLFIPDKDRDDHPDGPAQVMLEGFGFQDTHETLNNLTWGPDGWLYGLQGIFNHAQIGPPETPVEERIEMRAGVWRYHPLKHQFEVYAHGGSNPWGLDYDQHGQWFMTHCRSFWGQGATTHVVRGGHYWNQSNTHHANFIEPHPPKEESFYRSFLLASARYGHGEGGAGAPGSRRIYGGHSHVGTMIYQADLWPKEYRHQLFTHNLHGHQMNVQVNQPAGSTYHTIHSGRDFLYCDDPGYVAVDLKYGPDGAVYINDWYDTQHCHHPDSGRWDRATGRIYRVTPLEGYQPVLVDLTRKTDRQLAWMHLHQNAWYARVSRRVLQERAAVGVIAAEALDVLRNMSRQHGNANRRLRALWTLHAVGGITERDWVHYLEDPSEYVRAWAVELVSEAGPVPATVMGHLLIMSREDPSPVVRLRLASSTVRWPAQDAWKCLEFLATHVEDAEDPFLPSMVWFSLASRMPEDLERAFQLIEDETPMLPNLKSQMLWYAAKLQGEGLDRVMDYLSGAGDSKRASATLAMALALRGAARVPMPRRWNRVSPSLYQSREPRVRRAAERLAGVFGDPSVLPRMRVVLADTAQDDEERFHAMDILGRFRDTTTVPLYMALLDEPAFRQRAMQLLAHLDAPHLARTLLERLDQWSGQDKRVAFDTLTSRSSLALPLLDAVIEGKVDAGQLTAFYLRQMQDLRSLPVDQGIEKIWGQALPSHGTRLARIEALQEMYTQAPLWAYDADEGRKHFQLLCGPCHQSQGQLAPIGPSLEGSGTSGSRYFLESIIDPHAVIGQPYQVIEVQGAGGDILSGLLLEENETGVVIRTLTDTRQLDKAEITARRETKQSMMPEGLLDTLTTTQIIELLKYLTAL